MYYEIVDDKKPIKSYILNTLILSYGGGTYYY